MNEITPIHRSSASSVDAPKRADKAVTPPAGRTSAADQAEISTAAQMLSKLAQLPDVRSDLVQSVRQQIQAGTYDTPERLESAIDALLREEELA